MSPTRFFRLIMHELELQLRSRRLLLIAIMFIVAALLSGAASAGIFRMAEQALLEANPAMAGALTDPAIRAQALAEIWPSDGGVSIASLSRIEEFVVNLGQYLLPILLVLAFSDVLSGELRRRTLCYDTMHASRQTLLFAKLSTALIVSIGLVGVSLVSALLPTALFTELITVASVATSTASSFLRLAPLALACIPLVFFASAMTRQSFSSVFVAGLLVLVVPRVLWLAAWIAGEAGSDAAAQAITTLSWVFPSHAGTMLTEPAASALWTGLAVAISIGALWTTRASVALRRHQL